MTRKDSRFPKLLILICALNGCALTSKASATLPRYFSPDLPQHQIQEDIQHPEIELRIGRVTAGAYIREKIVYRESSYEIGFYDDRLWTEKPEAYLRRTLNRVF